jgi:glycosyltransferase-like protein
VRTVHHTDDFTTPALIACQRASILAPDRLLVVSEHWRWLLRHDYAVDAAVVHNGVDPGRFPPITTARRTMLRTAIGAEDRFVFLAVGGIEPRKGSLDLLEAFARLGEPGLRLVVAGGETLFDYRDYRTRWEKRAAELGVDPVVLGPVPHDELPSLMRSAAVFAFPSTKEGFGLAAMEALAAGVPVVTRDLPVLREVFDGVARFASTPAEFAVALRSALSAGPEDRAAGLALAHRYTWSAAAEAHREFYRSLPGFVV